MSKSKPLNPQPRTSEPSAQTRPLPAIRDALQLLQTAPPRPPELIHGFLYQGSKGSLCSSSKAGKTWAMMDLAVSVASGADWWGLRTSRARVLYCDFELPEWSFAYRLEQIATAKGLALEPDWLTLWNLRGHAAEITKLEDAIVAQCEGQHYGLILFDPLYKLTGGADENANRDTALIMNVFERIAVRTRAAVFYSHHFSKGNQSGKASIDRMSGAGVFARDPDSIMVMTAHETEDAFTVEATLRNHPPLAPWVMVREHPLFVRSDSLDPANLKQVGRGGPAAKYTDEKMLQPLTNGELSTTAWRDAMAEQFGMSKAQFFRNKERLEKEGKVQKMILNNTYVLR